MQPEKKFEFIIYTDGACDPNPGPGGWAAVILQDGGMRELSGHEDDTTNNRMELTAAIRALEAIPQGSRVILYTDSQYLQRGIEEWLPVWQKKGWRRKGGKLANVDLWQELAKLIQKNHVRWEWIRGHGGHFYNERVDYLAQARCLR